MPKEGSLTPQDVGVAGNFEYKEARAELPEDVAPAAAISTMNAIVDPTPQNLRRIKPFAVAIKAVPQTIPSEAQIVMGALFDCFTRQGDVHEGQVKDIIWGFEQVGIHPKLTITGLQQLERLGYTRLQGLDNVFVSAGDRFEECWLKYNQKLLDLIYEGGQI